MRRRSGRSLQSRWRVARRQSEQRMLNLPPAVKGMLWAAASGLVLCTLNTIVRSITLNLDPYQSLFLRYFCGLLVMLPLLRHGLALYRPKDIKGQFLRGAVHTVGLVLWFTALPKITLADMTALGFTGPIFIMLGAAWFLGEPMRRDRWIAALIGFSGVLVVVAPQLTGEAGWYTLIMLASSPMFAASFLITKALTRYEKPGVIVFWQSLTVSAFALPLALLHWQHPTPMQWVGFGFAGVLGSVGHYCMTRAFQITDISATQSLRFLDLVWSSLFGWLIFADIPSSSTLLGAMVILFSTIWIARRESRIKLNKPDNTA
jgi:drug/metabolite transporter (DMT)-like permease